MQIEGRGLATTKKTELVALTLGRCGAVFADQLIELVVLWYVWELTHSSATMSFATFAGRAPFWLFAFYGASLVDRFGPLRLLAMCNGLATLISVVVAIRLLLSGGDVATFVCLAFSLNTTRSLEAAALASTVPLITGQNLHRVANSYFDNAKRMGRLVAPLLSRLIGILSPGIFLLLAGSAYGATSLIAIKVGHGIETTRRMTHHPGLEGATGFVRNNGPLKVVIVTSAFYSLFHGIAYFVVLPRLAFDLDQQSPFSLGMLLTLFGVGGILANGVIARIAIQRYLGAVGAGMIVIGVCFALFAFGPPTWLRLVLALIAGASLPFQDVFVTCTIQAVGPPSLVARLHATWRLACEIAISAGLLVGGPAVELTSASHMGFISGAAIIVIGTTLVALQYANNGLQLKTPGQ